MPRTARLLARLAALSLVVGCGRSAEQYCRQAVEERTRNSPTHRFPAEEFLRVCRTLPAAHAQCTVPSYAGSYAVQSERGCVEAYRNPNFPRDLLLRN
ncbi:MAG: hypothetical protein U0326_21935 [Polyangiales bacterium]